MITNEPSTEQASLPSEPAGVPEQRVNEQIQAPPRPASEAAWLKLIMAIGAWFLSVFLLLIIPVIVAFPYLIYLARTTGFPRVEALASDKTFIFLSIVGIVPAHLLTLLLVWLVVTEFRRYPFWKAVGFEWPSSMSPAVGTLLCCSLAVILFIVGWGATTLFGGGKTQVDLLVESSLASRFATAFVAVVTAPLIEELIYRGVLYSAIQRTLGTVIAFIAVALLFAGVHVFQYSNNITVIIVITLLSITLTLARAYSGKILPSFIIHLVFNGIQSIIIVLSPFLNLGGSH